MGSLEEVSMPQNGIRAAGITALAAGLAANPNLHTINLNDNTFTETGAEAMAKALPKLQKLRVINFGDCLIRTKGAVAIADAIKEGQDELQVNCTFRSLSFYLLSQHSSYPKVSCLYAIEEKRYHFIKGVVTHFHQRLHHW